MEDDENADEGSHGQKNGGEKSENREQENDRDGCGIAAESETRKLNNGSLGGSEAGSGYGKQEPGAETSNRDRVQNSHQWTPFKNLVSPLLSRFCRCDAEESSFSSREME
jgi:hypothetical protein